MSSMPPLSHVPMSILVTWHDKQQPLVRALASPMVDDLTTALGMMQQHIDQRNDSLADYAAIAAKQQEQLTELSELVQSMTDESQKTQMALMSSQEALTSSQEALVSSQEDLASSQASVVDLTSKLQTTIDRIGVLERMQFGRKSEKRKPKVPDARNTAEKKRRSERTDEEKKARRNAAKAKRQAKLDALREVFHTVSLPDHVAAGRTMPPVKSVIYEWRPGELVRVNVSREQRAMPAGFIVTAAPVDQVVEGGSYGPALYAKVCNDKCLNAMPLRRQERAFKRLGVPLSASTLCSLFHRAGELMKPVYDALLAHVATAPHVSADETPMPVLDEHATRKGWMWVFATADALLFRHSPSRGKSVPEGVLGFTTGTLTVDGYTAYNSVTGELGRKRGGCWCHARRGLYDTLKHDEAFIQPLLNDIGELFYIEALAADQGILGTDEHLALRILKSKPAMDRVFAKLETYNADAVDARSSISKAVNYILNQRKPLQLFLSDAAVPIHNNLSERALRVIALMRKNSLFAGTDEAAQNFAQLLSLLATCQMHDVNPEAWLADVLIAIGEPGLIAEDLLPWNWKVTRGPKYRPYYDTT